MKLITLTTDFGIEDWFVGTMKGVILGIVSRALTVDITHGIPAGDIRAGAFALAASYRFFPEKTVHVAIADPGVGSQRKAIAVKTARYLFVGPDNGVLSFALAQEKIKAVHRLTDERFLLNPISRTFHGRDVFAPVAAHLSKGVPIHELGPELTDYVRLPWPEPHPLQNGVRGEIIYVDRFGNAITNICHLPEFAGSRCEIFHRQKRLCSLAAFYQAVPPGRPVAVFGSSGFLEISVNGGSAARVFGLKTGGAVIVRRLARHSQSPAS